MKRIFVLLLATLLLGLLGCCQGTPLAPVTPSPTQMPPTATAQPPTVLPTRQPTPTSSPRPTRGPTGPPTPRPTPAATATPTPFPITPLPGATGQIIFGAYPCSGPDKTDCSPFPGMDEYFGLYVINADGTGLRPIMDDELRARDLLTRLPYVPEAWVKQAEEAGHFERLGNVLSLFGYETIRWLPDGSAWLEPGKDGLYLIQSDGSGATRLVEGKIYYFDPSPEGKYVSYAKRNTISIIDLNNLNSREIAKMPARSITDIQWSPDKDWILVSATQGPSILCPSDIYAIDIHSRQTQNLFTVSEGCLLVARWSPDIQHIELIQCKPGQKYLNVLFNIYPDDKQKTQLAQITGLYGCIGHRAWSPKRTKWAFAGASGPWSSVRLHIADSETEHHQEILSGYVPIGPMLWITDSQ